MKDRFTLFCAILNFLAAGYLLSKGDFDLAIMFLSLAMFYSLYLHKQPKEF